jgi:hypothetical protein
VQVQGTVTAVGSGLPVRRAEVVIEWSRGTGGGGATLHTDREGHYAARRTVRSTTPTCDGMIITVRAPYYASAYNAYSDSTCGDKGVLTVDFKLIPLPR